LEGKAHLFVLDTGSVLTVYDSSLPLGTPKKRTTVETLSGNKTIEMFDAPNAWLGKLNFRSGSLVLGSDLSIVRQVSGREISGIIGMDFLSNYIVQIDFDTGRLSFLQSVPKDLGTPVPIFRAQDGPFIQVNLPGLAAPEKFLIDTGSMYFGNIRKELVETISKEGKARFIGTTPTAGLGGTVTKERWLVESLTMAGFPYHDVILTQTQDNLLGLGFWSGFTVTFDFPNNVLYLKKSRRSCKHNDLDMSGLHILRVGGKTIVHSVDEGSPAAVSGIRPNDIVLTIADEKADQVSMFALRQLLCSEGKKVRITIIRGEQTLNVTTVLKNMRP
jgi:hypothetical protein